MILMCLTKLTSEKHENHVSFQLFLLAYWKECYCFLAYLSSILLLCWKSINFRALIFTSFLSIYIYIYIYISTNNNLSSFLVFFYLIVLELLVGAVLTNSDDSGCPLSYLILPDILKTLNSYFWFCLFVHFQNQESVRNAIWHLLA